MFFNTFKMYKFYKNEYKIVKIGSITIKFLNISIEYDLSRWYGQIELNKTYFKCPIVVFCRQ